MKRVILLISVLLFCLTSGAFAETKEAETKKWQISVQQFTDSIPVIKNLDATMKRTVNYSNNMGVSAKCLFVEQNDPANSILRNIVSNLLWQFDYGQSTLEQDFVMTDSSSTKYKISNASYAGFGIGIDFNTPQPWRFSMTSLTKYGNIPNSTLTYSSYRNGGANFAKKIRGSWDSSDAIMELAYSTAPFEYLFGLEAIIRTLNLIYSDYPQSPAGTENTGKGSYSNSNVFVGFRSKLFSGGILELKYLPPINADWLQGFNVKAGWEF